MTKADLLDAYIQKNGILNSISCPIHDLVEELRRDGLGYTMLDTEATKAYLNYCKHGYNDATADFFAEYAGDVDKEHFMAKTLYYFLIDNRGSHTTKWLYKYSNDFRSYDRWLKAFERYMKNYADDSPLQINKKGNHLVFDSHVLDLATMGMTGKLWSRWCGVRAKRWSDFSKNTGRCLITEFFGKGGVLDQQNQEKATAEKEWREAYND